MITAHILFEYVHMSLSHHRYLKKAQNLDAKLQAAFEKIEAFNVEEESFGWDTTQYPMRQQVLNTLKPYLQLYEMTVEFNNKYKYVLIANHNKI